MDEIDLLLKEVSMKSMGCHLLWERLAAEGKFELINKLRRVEQKEPGYGTIVVPKTGFSDDDKTHNLVLDWLECQGVNIMNTRIEIARLKNALRSE